jgi:hypothetical protein
MSDLLIRDVPADVLTTLDKKAALLGLSRVEYIRRTLVQEAGVVSESCTEKHLTEFLALLPDLADEEVMNGAWR